ncbi:MAG: efflux RND transporter permease subunit [Acidobacteriota bacterium]
MSLSALAIRRPVTTAMFFVGCGLLGLVSLYRLRVELLPEPVYPEIFVVVTQRAASPEQVERDLLMPIEEEIGKLEGVAQIESSATLSRGIVRVSYAPRTGMKFALLQVQRHMGRLQPSLPEQTTINVQRFDTSALTSAVMELQVLGEGDLNWLRDFTEQKIRPELEAIDGVVGAVPLGGQQRAVEVIVDPELLAAHRLSMNEVSTAINSVNVPRTTLGRVFDGNQVFPVSVQGQFSDLVRIREVYLRPQVPLRLSDVASVDYGVQKRTDLSRVDGLPAVSIRVQKENEANLISVAAHLEAAVTRLNRELAPAGVKLLITSNQAELMNEALGTLKEAAAVGVALGLIVLFLLLRNLRFVVVLLLAIPASLLMTFNLMYAWDLSLNVLSLCGLALSMGMLADNGIVVMESIFKHFERGKPAALAARDGTVEVSRAIVASTATTVAVFLPVVFVQSDFQDILRELALAITFPLLSSLLVALTLVPMLAARTLSRISLRPLGTGHLLDMYTVVLKAGLRHRAPISVTVGVVLVVTLLVSFFFMLQQQAVEEESRFTVYVELPEGSTLDATDEVVGKVEEAVGELDGVERFTSSVREGQGSVTVMLIDYSEQPDRLPVEGLKEQLEAKTDEIEGAVIGFDPPAGTGGSRAGSRIGRRRGSGGFNLEQGSLADVAVIRGHDFATLQMIADDLSYRLEELEEIDENSVGVDLVRSAPEVQIIPDPTAMFDRGVQVNTVLRAVEQSSPLGFQSRTAFLEADGTETPIEVRFKEDSEGAVAVVADLRQLPVLTPSGALMPMEQVARVRTDEGRNSILRTDQSRRVLVSYRFVPEVLDSQPRLDAGRRLARTVVQDMMLPRGYSVEIDESEVDTVYYWMMGIAAVLVYMILGSLFESFASPIVIFCTLPTAVIGSCWALILSGTGLTSQAGPMALLGFVVLIGIAVNNGIILIDAINTLRSRHGFRRQRAVLTAGRSRVRPILMTSATTLLGVFPLALEFGGDYEIWPPFAITVLGGLAVSMVSTLVFVPVAYLGIDQVREWLRRIGAVGVTLASLAATGTGYAVYLRYESIFWTAMLALPAWFAFLGIIWAAMRLHRARRAARQAPATIRTIRLHTLTKIYGAPGRLRREWGRFERRARHLVAAGRDPVDRSAIREGLVWKLPVLALLGYLHTYVGDPVWVFLLTAATWGFLAHLARALLMLVGSGVVGQAQGAAGPAQRAAGLARGSARYGLLVLVLAYLQRRLGLASVTAATAAVFLGVRLVRFLARRVACGRIDPETLQGRLAWLRRRLYRGAAAVPLVGVPKRQFRALAGVNLEIGRGMFGLLGPNGAGKTTMMRIVCQLLEPTFGSVSIDGVSLREIDDLQGRIGYLPQHFGLYEQMSGYEYLEYRALLEGFRERTERRQRVLSCLAQVHLSDRMDDRIGSYSGGMRQRIGIAQTLLHMPQIMVVDEPTAGLDPIERIRFRNLLARLSQDRIVIFSTHIVEDVAGSCNRVAVLNDGRILYVGTPREMRGLAAGKVWEVVVPEASFDGVERQRKLISHLRTPAGVRARFLSEEPVEGLGAQPVEPTLEDAYIYLLEAHRRSA